MNLDKIKTKRKIILALFFVLLVPSLFIFSAQPADALFGWLTDSAGQAFFYVINIVLYSVFTLVTYPVTWASMLFGLTVDPVAVDTMFKMPVIYTLWQMIRDFFNLFFILTLLFIAFATIFQIDSFNYKKTLGKLLLMALLVNFSFPVTRFVIDAANVPMYFFMESMFEDPSKAKAGDVASTAFSTSNLETAILGADFKGYGSINGRDDLTTKLLVGIIFVFLFGVSLLVLALLFLIRSIMLVILIIFSPVGFVGKVIPGFSKYASEWWDALLKYAFFGPAAMLMMLVSVKFLEGFNKSIGSAADIAIKSSVAPGNTYLASMVAIMAPIIMIWVSITVGQKMGIHGASEVTGRAQKFSKWAGRNGAKGFGYLGVGTASGMLSAASLGRVPFASPMRINAVAAGAKEGWTNFRKTGKAFGKNVAVPFSQDSQEDRNAKYGAFAKGGRQAARDESRSRLYAHQKSAVDEHSKRISTMSDAELAEEHKRARAGKDNARHAATTQEVSKRKLGDEHGITQADMTSDMSRVESNYQEVDGHRNAVSDSARSEVAKGYGEAAYAHDASGQLSAAGEQQMREAIRRGEIDAAKISGVGITQNFMRLMAAEGKLNQQVVKTLKESNPTVDIDKHLDSALDKMGDDMATPGGAYDTASAEEKKRMEKAYTEMQKNYVYATGKFHSSATETDRDNVMKKADHETLIKMADTNKTEFNSEATRLAQMAGPGKTAAILAKMSEEGKDIQGAVDNLTTAANAFALPGTQQDLAQKAADKAVNRMKGDYRFDGIV